MLLDRWLGREGIRYFREYQLQEVICKHVETDEGKIDKLAGLGALNFLSLDDLPVAHEGEVLDPVSVIALPTRRGLPVFPDFSTDEDDPFLKAVHKSGHKWVVIVDAQGPPQLVLDADGFLRAATFEPEDCKIRRYCHRPILIRTDSAVLDEVLPRLYVRPESPEDDVIDNDIILIWSTERRIITDADVLGRLLRGIVRRRR